VALVIYRPIATQPVSDRPSPDLLSYRRCAMEPERDTDLSGFTVLIWGGWKSEATLNSIPPDLRC
jgi:hypothetical protein